MKKHTIKSIKEMSIETLNKLNGKELREVLSVSRKRIKAAVKRFSDRGINSPATRALDRSGGMITTNGKNVNQLRAELARARKFLNAKTSTISGYNKVKKDLSDRLNAEFTDSSESKLWQVYDKMIILHPDIYSLRDGSTRLQKLISDIIANSDEDMSIDDILTKAEEELNRLYEEVWEYDNSFSDIFDFWDDI